MEQAAVNVAATGDPSRDPAVPPLKTRPLSGALGVEILDIDLREELPPARIAQLREAWHQGLIVLLRDQALTEEDQVRFANISARRPKPSTSTTPAGIRRSC
jgi:alpha-ketoglutarate-dependent taurine dioxygenase